MITRFQQNVTAFSTAIYAMAVYVSQHWTEIINIITVEYPQERVRAGKIINEKRLIDATATLCVAAKIVKVFLLDYCGMEKNFVEKFYGDIVTAVSYNAVYNERMALTEPISAVFVKAVNLLLLEKKILLSNVRIMQETFEAFDGFQDEKYIYLCLEKVYPKVRQCLDSIKQEFSYNIRELQIALHEDGLLVVHSNGKGHKTYCLRVDLGANAKCNFLQIEKKKFFQMVNEQLGGNSYILQEEN